MNQYEELKKLGVIEFYFPGYWSGKLKVKDKCGTVGTMAERIGEDFNHLFLQLVEQNL